MSKYKLEINALSAKGEIYRHFKGGIYRKLFEAKNDNGEVDVVYEHLWPHEHGYFTKPKTVFESSVEINGNKLKRFAKVTRYLVTEDEECPTQSQSN